MAKEKRHLQDRPESTTGFVRELGQRLREARINRKMSQADVGDRLRLTSTAISNYESGISEMPIGRLHELANILGITMADLVSFPSPNYSLDPRIERKMVLSTIDRHLYPTGVLVIIVNQDKGVTYSTRLQPNNVKTINKIEELLSDDKLVWQHINHVTAQE